MKNFFQSLFKKKVIPAPIVEPPLLNHLPVGYRSWLDFYNSNIVAKPADHVHEIFLEEERSGILKEGDTTGTVKGVLVRYDLNKIKALVLDEVYPNLLDTDELKRAFYGLSNGPSCDKVLANAKEKILKQSYLLR